MEKPKPIEIEDFIDYNKIHNYKNTLEEISSIIIKTGFEGIDELIDSIEKSNPETELAITFLKQYLQTQKQYINFLEQTLDIE